MTRDELNELLEEVDACGEARTWTEKTKGSVPALWANCANGSWMLWLAARAGVDRKIVVRAACACARESLKYVRSGEDRPRIAIETAERWTRGEATIEDVRQARAAAYAAYVDDAAAYTAYAAYAAAYAADAAVYTAYAAYAADAAYAYAAAAAYTAYTAYAAYAADAAAADARQQARAKSLARAADIVRAHITYATIAKALARKQAA